LAILKNEALEKAVTYEEKYKIQKDYITLLLEIATMFHGKEQIAIYQQNIKKREESLSKISPILRMKLSNKYEELGLEPPPELKVDINEVIELFRKEKKDTKVG